jgi:hypothetical protein
MSTESQLREKLRKIEALFAGAGTTGERLAAEAALERVRARLTELGHKDSPVEMQFSMPDQWSRHLFLALCRRYGLSPYRLHRQRRNTVMVRAPRGFVDQVLWPEFGELDRALQAYLHEVTLRVIRDEVFADASEAQEVPEALIPLRWGMPHWDRREGRCGTGHSGATLPADFEAGRTTHRPAMVKPPVYARQQRGTAADDTAFAVSAGPGRAPRAHRLSQREAVP